MALFNNRHLFKSLRNSFSVLKGVVIKTIITLTLLWVTNNNSFTQKETLKPDTWLQVLSVPIWKIEGSGQGISKASILIRKLYSKRPVELPQK